MLFGIVRRTLQGPRLRERFGTQANGLAAAVAIVWAVHPMQTESVTYIIQRMESLMGLFLLLTLYCVIRGHDSLRRYGGTRGSYLLRTGDGDKEGMAIAPIIVLLYDRIFLADSWADLSNKRSALIYRLGCNLADSDFARIVINMARGGGLLGFPAVSWWRYAQNQFGAIAHYFRLAFWPDTLCIDYGWQVSNLPKSWIAVGAMLVIWLLAATGWALANDPPLGFLGAWFFLTLAPTSSLVPILDMVAERRMYLPLAAVVTLAVIAAWNGLTTLSRRFELTHELRVDGLSLRSSQERWLGGRQSGIRIITARSPFGPHDPGTAAEWPRLEQSRLFVLQGGATRFGRRLFSACD